MNKRKVGSFISKLEALKEKVATLGAEMEEFAEAERSKWDDRSEKYQESEKGEAESEDIGNVEQAASYANDGDIESALDALGSIEVD